MGVAIVMVEQNAKQALQIERDSGFVLVQGSTVIQMFVILLALKLGKLWVVDCNARLYKCIFANYIIVPPLRRKSS